MTLLENVSPQQLESVVAAARASGQSVKITVEIAAPAAPAAPRDKAARPLAQGALPAQAKSTIGTPRPRMQPRAPVPAVSRRRQVATSSAAPSASPPRPAPEATRVPRARC